MFRKIVDFCAKNGLLKLLDYPSANQFELKIGPPGALLQENLKNEWLDNFINNKEVSVFYSHEDFRSSYSYVRNLMFQTVPLGILEVVPIKKTSFIDVENFSKLRVQTEVPHDFADYFMNDFRLVCTFFVAPSVGNQFFHQIQRQRKIWWRKISASPGRYSLGDIQNGNGINNSLLSSVNIEAKYPWGKQILESININFKNYSGISTKDLMIKDGKKEVPAVFIECETKLSHLFLNTLCDAYEEPLFQDEKRPLLRFHRKMAPYKISFSITSTKAESLKELQDLALYLSKLLRNNYITTLLLPSNVRKTLEAQYRQYDELGIPYSLLLNEGTLRDGIAWLRSRDSTLKEQVHVADVVNYVEKIFKNF